MNVKQRSKKFRKKWRPFIYSRDNCRCAYCGNQFPESKLSVDHWWPAYLGGEDAPANLVTACRECNKLKSHLPPLFFRTHRIELIIASEMEGELCSKVRKSKQKREKE